MKVDGCLDKVKENCVGVLVKDDEALAKEVKDPGVTA